MNLKKIIPIFLIIFILFGLFLISDDSKTTVYLDGENVTVNSLGFPFIHDTYDMSQEITDYVSLEMSNPNVNSIYLKRGIDEISRKHGFNDNYITIDSSLGEDKIPIIFHVDGTSMYPTLDDGQMILVEATKNISVGDIVVADDSYYGLIVKRVRIIDGNDVFLVSDNKNIDYEVIDGYLYESRGIQTWTSLSNIIGIVRKY